MNKDINICTISDTHGWHKEVEVPECDVLICAGDCMLGEKNTRDFLSWISNQKAEHKVVIAGNHDNYAFTCGRTAFKEEAGAYGVTYVEDESVIVQGYKIYGSPWVIPFGNWDFQLKQSRLNWKWKRIPEDTDILVTHMPIYSAFDMGFGDEELLQQVLQKNILLCIYGHAHIRGDKLLNTPVVRSGMKIHPTCINASCCADRNILVHREPVTFRFDQGFCYFPENSFTNVEDLMRSLNEEEEDE